MRVQTDRIDAVVLAGGVNQIALFAGDTPGYKALLPIGGQPAIRYTLDALRAVPQVQRICIVGPEAELRAALGAEGDRYLYAPDGGSLIESIFSGLSHFADAPMVLFATADLPLITPRAISDFLTGCAVIETEYAENMFLSVVPQQYYTGPYVNFPKPFNRFKDASICHGNLFLVDPRLMRNTHATRRMNALYHARKNPISSALAFGLRVGLSYVLGVHMWHLLTLAHMASMASRRFGIGLVPVSIPHPGITLDIDEPADYTFVTEQLGAGSA